MSFTTGDIVELRQWNNTYTQFTIIKFVAISLSSMFLARISSIVVFTSQHALSRRPEGNWTYFNIARCTFALDACIRFDHGFGIRYKSCHMSSSKCKKWSRSVESISKSAGPKKASEAHSTIVRWVHLSRETFRSIVFTLDERIPSVGISLQVHFSFSSLRVFDCSSSNRGPGCNWDFMNPSARWARGLCSGLRWRPSIASREVEEGIHIASKPALVEPNCFIISLMYSWNVRSFMFRSTADTSAAESITYIVWPATVMDMGSRTSPKCFLKC